MESHEEPRTSPKAPASPKRKHSWRRRVLLRIVIYGGVFVVLPGSAWWWMFWMPGDTFEGEAPALTDDEQELAANLRRHVERLAGEIGIRDTGKPERLEEAAVYIETALARWGYPVERQPFEARGFNVANLVAEIEGTQEKGEIVVIGAHYDSASNPGADDNASGVAGLLEIARRLAGARPERTLRFVLFVNEEPPYFQSNDMGSRVYARRAREAGEEIVAMISLEMLGYYDPSSDAQDYPSWIYEWLFPTTGDFLAFLGNFSSRSLVHESIREFRANARLPSEGAVLTEWTIGQSDHWSFWQEGYPAIMVTDTAMYRNANYHTMLDMPETLDYDRFARAVHGLVHVVRRLARIEGGGEGQIPRAMPDTPARASLPPEFPLPPEARVIGSFVFENGTIKVELGWIAERDDALAFFESGLAGRGWILGERFTNALGGGVLLPAEGHGFKGSVLVKPANGETNINITLEPKQD